jgi:hypothetical protein
MLLAMSFLAVLCMLMGLLFVVPSLRSVVLEPAVAVLMQRFGYAAALTAG